MPVQHKISDYGQRLRDGKARLGAAMRAAGVTNRDRRALLLAMAMLETNRLSLSERDCGKDSLQACGTANVSIFNLNLDMLRELGLARGAEAALNTDAGLPEAVRWLERAFARWGEGRTLAFVRGGRTAFEDGVSYGAKQYSDVIYYIRELIRRDEALFSDGRRVEVYLQHV